MGFYAYPDVIPCHRGTGFDSMVTWRDAQKVCSLTVQSIHGLVEGFQYNILFYKNTTHSIKWLF